MSERLLQQQDWEQISTILLDLDGTLLDLHFDQQFWQHLLPQRFAELSGLSLEAARQQLAPRFEAVAGTLDWYCLDYWSRELGLDILDLKYEIQHLIAIHPHVTEFLLLVRSLGKQVVLTTNAHADSLSLKMARVDLRPYFDVMVSAHALGRPKEDVEFWKLLGEVIDYHPGASLLVDDNLHALQSARDFGIRYPVGVRHPDSKGPASSYDGFDAIVDFRQLMPDFGPE